MRKKPREQWAIRTSTGGHITEPAWTKEDAERAAIGFDVPVRITELPTRSRKAR